jgi:acyl-CoA synthetase (NDP forming)
VKTFVNPTSIAVVGASTRRIGHQIIENLLYGYQGRIYPVNPNHSEIAGLPCFSSLEDISSPVDLAIILVPAPVTPSVLESCARKGIRRVMIQSAGFAEVGEAGKAVQDRCTAIAKAAGIRVWGPNCMGLVDIPGKQYLTFMHPSVYADGLVPGRISLVVQSGMLSGVFLTEMSRRAIGIGKVCSIGNKSDLDECDILEYLLDDPETDAVALYLESMPRGRVFTQLARQSTKPIVVLKGGQSQTGAKAAMSHTSSLSGNSRLLHSVLEMAGVTMAKDFNHMVHLALAMASTPKVSPKCRTAIITFSGGAGILTCDMLEKYKLDVAQLSKNTCTALKGIFPDWMPVNNPIDLYPAIELKGYIPVFNQACNIVLDDPNVDVMIIHFLAGVEDRMMDLKALKKKADTVEKAVIFWLVGRQRSTRMFREEAQTHGFPVYSEISRAVECLSAAAHFKPRKASVDGHAHLGLRSGMDNQPLLLYSSDSIWDEYDSKRLLKNGRIPVVKEKIILTLPEARKAIHKIGFPAVLKGLLPGEVHKTEKDLIRLGIHTGRELEMAYRDIRKGLEGGGRILLQQQVAMDYELIAGFVRDSQFGPCVMFGLGGILSELKADVVFALAPLERWEALELLERIHGRRLLAGYRGMPPLDQDLMAEMLINLSRLGFENPQIEQIDINPVAVVDGTPVAVDATVILKQSVRS